MGRNLGPAMDTTKRRESLTFLRTTKPAEALRRFRHSAVRCAQALGLCETRCTHCLRPFTPVSDGAGSAQTKRADSADSADSVDSIDSVNAKIASLADTTASPTTILGTNFATTSATNSDTTSDSSSNTDLHTNLSASARPVKNRALLCPECTPLFAAYNGPSCPRCGLPPAGADDLYAKPAPLCGRCLVHDPPWNALAYHGLYKGALRHSLLRLKFSSEFSLTPLLAACLFEASHRLPLADMLTAVPQHPAHLRQRGFNQAHELAKGLSALSGLPLRPEILCRLTLSRHQAGLSRDERRRNVLHAFTANNYVQGARVRLIDDVMTTGSTLEAATLALLRAGAAEVQLLFVARTPIP